MPLCKKEYNEIHMLLKCRETDTNMREKILNNMWLQVKEKITHK